MADDIEQELLELHDLDADAVARVPPSVGIEGRIACGTNDNSGRMAVQGAVKRSTHTTRVIGGAHHDDGAKLALIAPAEKHATLLVCPGRGIGNYFNVRHSERVQHLNEVCCLVLVRNASTTKFLFRGLGRLSEDGDPVRNSALDQIRRIDGACGAGPLRDHNHVSRRDRFIDHQRPANRSENRAANDRHSTCECDRDQHDREQNSNPPSPPNPHVLMIRRIMRVAGSEIQ